MNINVILLVVIKDSSGFPGKCITQLVWLDQAAAPAGEEIEGPVCLTQSGSRTNMCSLCWPACLLGSRRMSLTFGLVSHGNACCILHSTHSLGATYCNKVGHVSLQRFDRAYQFPVRISPKQIIIERYGNASDGMNVRMPRRRRSI